MSSILKVEDLNVSYGAINALKGVTFDVEEGSIVSQMEQERARFLTRLYRLFHTITAPSRFRVKTLRNTTRLT